MKRRHFIKTLITAISSFAITTRKTIAVNAKHNNDMNVISNDVLGLSTITLAVELYGIDHDGLETDQDFGLYESDFDEYECIHVIFMVKLIENMPWSNKLVGAWFTEKEHFEAIRNNFSRNSLWILSGTYTIEKLDDGSEWLELDNPVYMKYSEMIENQHLI